jgi:squalene synthase HpnC
VKNHYENFPVASFLLPRKIRKHVCAIYAFARQADDLSDIHKDRAGLLKWREQLYDLENNLPSNPIFIALRDTIQKCSIPIELLDDLISAFLMDLEKTRYKNLRELFNYCKYSANPIGRLVLLLHGNRDEENFIYSDQICTALQLTNFWQDVSYDIKNGRIYIPKNCMFKFQVKEHQIERKEFDYNFKKMMSELLNETYIIFGDGLPLLKKIQGRLKWELYFTMQGGIAILDKIKKNDYNVLDKRPTLRKIDWLKILIKFIFGGGKKIHEY